MKDVGSKALSKREPMALFYSGTLAPIYTGIDKHGNIDCLFQVWIWDNIKGESLIFVADEVNDISDEERRDNPQIKDADQVTNHQLPPLVFACLTRYSLDGK